MLAIYKDTSLLTEELTIRRSGVDLITQPRECDTVLGRDIGPCKGCFFRGRKCPKVSHRPKDHCCSCAWADGKARIWVQI